MTLDASPQDVVVSPDHLARLMPLYLVVGPTGEVLDAGPTLARVVGSLSGRRLFDCFEILRPRGIYDMKSVAEAANKTFHLRTVGEPSTSFRAVCAPTPNGTSAFLFNLSFGINVVDAVNRHGLTLSDFASTDLAVEMLYTLEAKAAAMEATRDLICRLEDARSDAELRSVTDALTDLPNRRGFEKHVFRLTDLGEPFSVMAIDLDRFKEVNDRHGHTVGDAVLKEAAARLALTLRGADIVARIGGDEFLAVLKGEICHDELVEIGERLIGALSVPIEVGDVVCQIGASVGVARVDAGFDDQAVLMIDRADSALYQSKRSGRGTITVVDA